MSKTSLSYEKLGASADKKGLHDVLDSVSQKTGTVHDQIYFCQVLPDLAGDEEYFSFIHCDGAGTKTIVPYLHYKASGDPSFFQRLAQDALVMNLDDALCLGPVESLVLANTIARNSELVPNDAIEQLILGYNLLVAELEKQGVALSLGGGETADCADTVRTLVADATLMGRIKKNSAIDPRNITPGDVIVGLSSAGQASYESFQNSGIGSNGLTLARHALLNAASVEKYPEICTESFSKEHNYVGPFSVSDTPDSLGMSIGDALSSPTRTYAPVLHKCYDELLSEIHGVIHLTGGAHGKVLRFCPPCKIVKDNVFEPPAIFKLIQEHGAVSKEEMYKVFNMGQRMELYCEESTAAKIIEISRSFNIDAQIIGHVEKAETASVEMQVGGESWVYTLS